MATLCLFVTFYDQLVKLVAATLISEYLYLLRAQGNKRYQEIWQK